MFEVFGWCLECCDLGAMALGDFAWLSRIRVQNVWIHQISSIEVSKAFCRLERVRVSLYLGLRF